jgi:predicted acylesterase/phospholipase RssA
MLDVSSTRLIERGGEQAERAQKPAQEQRQVVLVFQGGGALGAYQAGVYQALHESGIEPDWIIGTSIGAINASLIAGNEPENRLDRLEEFWRRMRRKEFWGLSNWPGLADTTSYWSTVLRAQSIGVSRRACMGLTQRSKAASTGKVGVNDGNMLSQARVSNFPLEKIV